MAKSNLGLTFVVSCLVILSLIATPSAAVSPTYPTTAITNTGMVLASIGPTHGVLVNYTSTFTGNFSGIVYVDLTNSKGQTVNWNVGSCNFSQGNLNQCYVIISQAVPSGTYTAKVFTTTSTDIAVSTVSSLTLSV